MKLLQLFKKRLKSTPVEIKKHHKDQKLQTNTSNKKVASKDEDTFMFI